MSDYVLDVGEFFRLTAWLDQQQHVLAINISCILLCSWTVWLDVVTHIITPSSVRKQSGVIKSYYSGFPSSGVAGIKISFFDGRFLTPTPVMLPPIFRGMSEVWLCTSFQISQQTVLKGLTTLMSHLSLDIYSNPC